MTNTVSNAVATRDAQKPNTPGAMVKQHAASFRQVLPSHVKAVTWVRLAQGALKKGKRVVHPQTRQPCTELELAAANNPGVFLASLLEAARLGLEPGTEQYYLTPRKVKGQLEILGIVGYQGHIELMYRAGAISSVVAECVYANDKFRYQPGLDERPAHEIDWDAEDRGALRLVYAFAVMKDGATSKVVVLNKASIARIKQSSQGADGEYSPWQKHEAAMWLKSAVRQLSKWVPTSAEFITTQLRAERAADTHDAGIDPDWANANGALPEPTFDEDGIVEAEIVDEAPDSDDVPEATSPAPGPITTSQVRTLGGLMRQAGIADDEALRGRLLSHAIGHRVDHVKHLNADEANHVIENLQALSHDDMDALTTSLKQEADEEALMAQAEAELAAAEGGE